MRSIKPLVVLVNRSDAPDTTIMKVVQALQRQVSQDFAKAWGVEARVEMMRRGDRRPPNPDAFWVAILASRDQPEAAGYADLTPNGKPLALVFADEVAADGEELSVAVSREVLEMLADSSLNGFEHRASDSKLYAREICDPVQGRANSYMIQGVRVSDFVYPAFYQEGSKGPFDHRRAVKAPFEPAEGGFLPRISELVGGDATWEDMPEQDARPRSRLDKRLRALAGTLQLSHEATAAPLAPTPKPGPKLPARRESQIAKAPPLKIRPVPAVPRRQPDRGGNAAFPGIGGRAAKVPLRQPLRGSRAEAARIAEEHAAQVAAAVAEAPKIPARQPRRGARVNQEPKQHGEEVKIPARQPQRGVRSSPAEAPALEEGQAPVAPPATTPTPPAAQAEPPAAGTAESK